MNSYINLKFWVFFFLLVPVFLQAADKRTVPLDLYLVIDASEGFREAKDMTVAWISEEVFDRLLQEGDRLVIWSAGDSARIIHTETVGSKTDEAKEKLRKMEIQGGDADFSTAVQETSRAAREAAAEKRISYTLMVTGSAITMAPTLEGGSGLFRWSRAEKYSGWQALVVAPGIGEKVRQAAAAYMNSR